MYFSSSQSLRAPSPDIQTLRWPSYRRACVIVCIWNRSLYIRTAIISVIIYNDCEKLVCIYNDQLKPVLLYNDQVELVFIYNDTPVRHSINRLVFCIMASHYMKWKISITLYIIGSTKIFLSHFCFDFLFLPHWTFK